MKSITCLHPKYLIPVEPKATVLLAYSLVMQNGKIIAVLPESDVRLRYQDATHIELKEHALTPGLSISMPILP
jgi:5-methylthioadenosine/S-adenosylhomocysteine deaminase